MSTVIQAYNKHIKNFFLYKKGAIIISVLACITIGPSNIIAQNLITNASFENGTASWNTSGNTSVPNNNSACDTHHAYIGNGGSFAQNYFDANETCEYTLTFEAERLNVGSGWAVVSMSAVDTDNGWNNLVTNDISISTAGWNSYTITFTTPVDTDAISLWMGTGSGGSFKIDCISLTRSCSNLLINSGFENGTANWNTSGSTSVPNNNSACDTHHAYIGNGGSFSQNYFNANENCEYTLTFEAERLNVGSGWASVAISAVDTDNGWTNLLTNDVIISTAGWNTYTLTISTPPDTDVIGLWMGTGSGGSVKIDCMDLSENCSSGCALTNPYPGFPIDFLNNNTGWLDYDLDSDLYLSDNGDGTMTISGHLINGTPVDFGSGTNVNSCGTNDSWSVSFTLSDKKNWTEWQSMGGSANLHSNCSSLASSLDYWDITGTLIGTGCNSGRTITITGPKSPYRLQIGNGANSGDASCAFGMSTWFDGTEAGAAINSDIYTFLDQVCYQGLSPNEICDNGIDDDGDGLIDCNDSDCGSPTVVEAGPDKTICSGGSNSNIVLEGNASGGSSSLTYSWAPITGLDNPNILMPTASPTTTTTYTLTVTGDNGCTSTDSVTVNVISSPTASATGETICAGETATLLSNITGGTENYNYQWQLSASGNTDWSDISGATNTTYTTPALVATSYYRLLVTTPEGVCADVTTNTAIVNVELASTIVTVSADLEQYCSGGTTTLTVNEDIATGDVIDYSVWSVGTGSSGNFTVNGSNAENHRIIGSDPWGNSTVVWEARPDATSNADGGWNTSLFSIDHTKLYRVSVWVNRKIVGNNGRFYMGTRGYGSTNGLERISNGTITTNPYFWISATPPTLLQQDEWVLVVGHIYPSSHTGTTNHSDSGRYTTSEGKVGGISNDFQFLPSTTTAMHRSYLYFCTDVSVRQQWAYPRFDIVDGTEPSIDDLLGGFDVNGGLGQGAEWQWYEGSCGGTSIGSGTSINVNPTATTTYYVRAEGDCNTTDCHSVIVTVNDPTQAIATNDGSISCSDDTVTITATPSGMTYLWNTGETTHTIDVTVPDTYSVTVTDTNGCSSTAENTVNDNTTPTPIFCQRYRLRENNVWGSWITFSNDCSIEFCEQDGLTDLQFDGGPDINTGWVWTDESGNIDNEVDEIVVFHNLKESDSGTYSGTLTNEYGCISTLSFDITIYTNPIADAGDDTIACNDSSATLTATGGTSYLWNDNVESTTASITVSPSIATTYTVTVTNDLGCSNVDSVIVTPSISVNIGEEQEICHDEFANIIPTITGGTTPITYSWEGPEGFLSTEESISVSEEGAYTVTVTDSNGCTAIDMVAIQIKDTEPGQINETTIECPSNDPNEITSLESPSYCNYIYNHQLNEGLDQWHVCSHSSITNAITAVLDDNNELSGRNSAFLEITENTGVRWHHQLIFFDNEIIEGESYTISFETKATGIKNVRVLLQVNEAPWDVYHSETVTVGTTADIYTMTAAASSSVDNLRLVFDLGENDEDIWMDNIIFKNVSCSEPTFTYIWECRESDGNGGWTSWTTITGATGATYDPPAQNNIKQYRRLSSVAGCDDYSASNIIEVDVCPCQVSAGDDATICQGESVIIQAQAEGTAPFSYSWSPTTGLDNPSIENPSASPLVTTTYTVTVTDNLSCTSTGEVVVTVHEAESNIILPQSNCSEHSSSYEATEVAGATYLWDFGTATTADGDNNDIIEDVIWPSTYIDTTVTITLTVTTAEGCISTATESVTTYALPEDDIQGDAFVEENSSDKIYEGPVASSYAWSVIEGDAIIDGATNGATCVIDFFTENSTLQLIVSNDVGCLDTIYQSVGMNSSVECNFYDNFGQRAYNNSHGTQDWSPNPWIEYNDDNNPITGEVRIIGNRLRLHNPTVGPTVYIERAVNLNQVTNPTLTFEFWQENGVGNYDLFEVDVYDGTTWTTIYSLFGKKPGGFKPSFDLTPYANANTKIRFKIPEGYTDSSKATRIDDVFINGNCNICAFDFVGLQSENTCEGHCDGTIFIAPDYPVTGDFNLSYTYNGTVTNLGPFTTADTVFITGLCTGVYTDITISRIDNQCSEVWPESLTIGETGAEWEHVTHTDNIDNCDGDCNGSFTVDANHGLTGEFTVSYTFEGTVTTLGPYDFAGDILIDDLCEGVYSNITITGTESGCSDIWPDEIEILIDRPEANIIAYQDDNCQEGSGEVIVEVGGGMSPYTIEWHSEDGSDTGSTILNSTGKITIDGLIGGNTYCISVSDINGCNNE